MCREGHYFFLWIALDAKSGGIEYHFRVFGMIRPGIEPRSPGPLVNTLLIRPGHFSYDPQLVIVDHRMTESTDESLVSVTKILKLILRWGFKTKDAIISVSTYII